MTRLRHSDSAYLRQMQMSQTQLFVFVEGKRCDPYFYGAICGEAIGDRVRYEVVQASQLPGGAGGKKALLGFFSYLRRNSALFSSFKGADTAAVFFCDKDLDDLTRARLRSRHLVYTEHYSVENYVFLHGDLTRGASSAASVDPLRLAGRIGDAAAWCKRIAFLWSDWLALCLYMAREGATCEANYSVLSKVQTRLCGPTDQAKYDELVADLAGRAGTPLEEFRAAVVRVGRKVRRYCRAGKHHKIFNGKWFEAVLADEVNCIMAGSPYDGGHVSGRLGACVAGTIGFADVWAEHFKRRLREIVARL